MTQAEQITFTVQVFTNVKLNNRQRSLNAIRRREETQDLLDKGEDNYRTQWIRESVLRVVDTLGAIAEDFDRKHPDDRCTVRDWGDILMSTIRTLQRL